MVSVLISTVYDRLHLLNAECFPLNEELSYFISCQGLRNKDLSHYEEILASVFGDNYYCSFIEGYGLSINRNNAIKLALSKSKPNTYFYICDDDVSIDVDSLLAAAAIAAKKKLSCTVGVVNTKDGYFKNYPKNIKKYSRLDCSKVSSVEMLICSGFIQRHKLSFDENFGLGSKYPSGEEFIFCNDIISLGGSVYFLPKILCEHPPVSSGSDFFSSEHKIVAKGAMFSRVFGRRLGVILSLMFAIKKFTHFKREVNFFKFTKYIIKGALQ
tara:strand:+ start:9234 stop:10043 length:810 start_codon:yes stop_codon:yes gene_type:complete